MLPEFWHYRSILAASLTLAALGGCKGRDQADTGSPAMESGSPGESAGTMMADPAAAPAGPGLTDANVVALLDEANMADSSLAAYAVTKATSSEVKDFARLMMGEHHALRAQGQQLAARLHVTPQLPANDPLKPAAASEMATLQAAAKGPRFDRTYIEQEIGMHKAVLDLAGKGHDAAQNAELKHLIEQAKPVLEKHLDRAEAIQKKLSRPSA